jgi:hypothetical protein
MLGALSSRSALSLLFGVLFGVLFEKFCLFLNTPHMFTPSKWCLSYRVPYSLQKPCVPFSSPYMSHALSSLDMYIVCVHKKIY